jgi:subtilisin
LLFFRLTSRTKLFWANLLFILMVGVIGAQALSSQGVNAQLGNQPAQQIPTGVKRVGADLSVAFPPRGVDVDADIAIIDRGVAAHHPDLNVYRCLTFSSPKSLVATNTPIVIKENECRDERGHGTSVAGVAAAKNNNIGTVGTAPGARIWALDVCDPVCTPNAMLAAYRYVLAHADEIDVVNISLGVNFPTNFKEDKNAIDAIISKGVVVVVSAGNENRDVKGRSPSGVPAAITVSAIADTDGKCGGKGPATPVNGVINPDDFILSTSNFGSGVDFAAPGNYIRTTTIPDGYDNTASDTSVAAPHVAGAAALIKSLHPNASPAQIEKILHNDATKVPPASLKAPVDPRQPCDGKARGYFAHAYPPSSKVRPGSDKLPFHYEDLLFMGNIK